MRNSQVFIALWTFSESTCIHLFAELCRRNEEGHEGPLFHSVRFRSIYFHLQACTWKLKQLWIFQAPYQLPRRTRTSGCWWGSIGQQSFQTLGHNLDVDPSQRLLDLLQTLTYFKHLLKEHSLLSAFKRDVLQCFASFWMCKAASCKDLQGLIFSSAGKAMLQSKAWKQCKISCTIFNFNVREALVIS